MALVRDLVLSPRRTLPARLLSVRFSRAGGPGGQHVNKVETRVELLLDLAGAEALLGAAATRRLRARHPRRLDAAGRLAVACGRHRERHRNVEEAHRRLEALLREALRPQRPRRETRPSAAGRERRLEAKRRRARRKRERARAGEDD